MSETYAGETYARGGQEQTTAGSVILVAISLLTAFLVIAGLGYAAGTGGRHKAALAAAGCEPNLSPSGLQCTTWRVIHAPRQKCKPITAEMVVANVSMGRR